eukprot:1442799-Prymnesium_polylepis.1
MHFGHVVASHDVCPSTHGRRPAIEGGTAAEETAHTKCGARGCRQNTKELAHRNSPDEGLEEVV